MRKHLYGEEKKIKIKKKQKLNNDENDDGKVYFGRLYK